MNGKLEAWDEVKRFMLAGNATFTLVSRRTGERFTYRVRVPKKSVNPSGVGPYFVSLLSGPDNTADYAYMGILATDASSLKPTMGSRVSPSAKSHRAFAFFLGRMAAGGAPCTSMEVWHEGRCGRCGRALTVPSSVAAGIGPECAGRL
jgi:hypothetical protein